MVVDTLENMTNDLGVNLLLLRCLYSVWTITYKHGKWWGQNVCKVHAAMLGGLLPQ